MNTLKTYVNKFFQGLNNSSDSDKEKMHYYKNYISSAIMEFFDDEVKKEAYDVLSIFLDIYRVNISGERSFVDLLDVLKSYEEKASVLIDNQRDHYVHSMNVFLLGLAVYAGNESYRNVFAAFLKDADKQIKHFDTVNEEFFFRWGIASLFHDAGYPIEIINNQFNKFIAYVSGRDENGKAAAKPYLSYFNFDQINSITNFDSSKFIFPQYISDSGEYNTVMDCRLTDYIALNISCSLDIPHDSVKEKLNGFLASMQKYQFVDHGFYSALIIMKWFGELMLMNPEPTGLLFSHILDSAAAIFIHNAYRNVFIKEPFSLPPLHPQKHPIGFLLVLCDEVQEWNREAYGISNKKMVSIDDSNIYIDNTVFKLHYITKTGVVNDDFITEKMNLLNKLLDWKSILFEEISITATTLTEQYIFSLASKNDSLTPRLLIEHIEMIAMNIHVRYNQKIHEKNPEKPLEYPTWESLPDTLKYSNVRQAKDMVSKLREIGCYIAECSDDYQVLELTPDEIEHLAKIEHDAWMEERLKNGWVYSEARSAKLKKSPYLKPYEELTDDIKELDREAIRNIIPILEEVNLKVYSETRKEMV